MINIKYCKECGRAYNIGCNLDVCPACRKKKVLKGWVELKEVGKPNKWE